MDSVRFQSAHLLRATCLLILVLLSSCAGRGEADSLALVALLENGRFTALESELGGYQKRFEADQADQAKQWPAYKAFFAFANADPAIELRLGEWIAMMPRSYAAPLARGIFYANLGWVRRGTAYASQTPTQRFADMHRFFELANTDFQHALAVNPYLAVAYASIARMALGEGSHEDMESALRAGLTVMPESVPLHLAFLDDLDPKWGGSVVEIRAYLRALEQDHPKIAALKWFAGYEDYAEGMALLDDGRFDDALARFDRALSFDGQDPGYRSARAKALFMLDREAEAAATLEPVLAAEPQNPAFLEQMARIRYYQLRPDDALANIDKALAFNHYDPDYLRLRAQILAGVMRYAEAVRTLDDALVYGGDDPRILTERSNDLQYVGRLPEAIETARRATELAPDYSRAWLQYADILAIGRDCRAKQALRIFRTVCKYDGMCGEESKSSVPPTIPLMLCQGA